MDSRGRNVRPCYMEAYVVQHRPHDYNNVTNMKRRLKKENKITSTATPAQKLIVDYSLENVTDCLGAGSRVPVSDAPVGFAWRRTQFPAVDRIFVA